MKNCYTFAIKSFSTMDIKNVIRRHGMQLQDDRQFPIVVIKASCSSATRFGLYHQIIVPLYAFRESSIKSKLINYFEMIIRIVPIIQAFSFDFKISCCICFSSYLQRMAILSLPSLSKHSAIAFRA